MTRALQQAGARCLALLLMALGGATAVRADPIPPGWQGRNITPIGYSALGGDPTVYESIAIKHARNGRWYLYGGRGKQLMVLDVTDPRNPIVAAVIDTPAMQVTVHGDLLISSLARENTPEYLADIMAGRVPNPVLVPAPVNLSDPMRDGVLIWDISDPVKPKVLSHWQSHGLGSHQISYPGGKYAYLSTSVPGFRGMYILVTLDVSDPRHPKEAGRFWLPGQKADEPVGEVLPGFHGPLTLSPDGKLGSAGYTPYVLNLDMTDPARPTVIGKLTMIPPFAYVGTQSVHTVLPVWDRHLLIATQEPMKGACRDQGTYFTAIIDNHDPAKPALLSMFPRPLPPPGASYTDFCDRGGRFGPHNMSREQHSPDVEQTGNLVYMTYFNAGLRIFDISDPRQPAEAGWFLPPIPTRPVVMQAGRIAVNQTQDVLVDARGNIFITDSAWGLMVLRYTGPGQPTPTQQ